VLDVPRRSETKTRAKAEGLRRIGKKGVTRGRIGASFKCRRRVRALAPANLCRLSFTVGVSILRQEDQTTPAMNAYLFTAVVTRSQVRPAPGSRGPVNTLQTWDTSMSQIVLGGSPDEAQRRFEAWLRTTPEGENPVEVTIRKIAAAQLVEQLFTESGGAPLDWPEIPKQVLAQLESTLVDNFEQGYWVDVEQVIRPEGLSPNVEWLQRDLPEDIRSGLNWSADKQFLFLLSVLAPLVPPLDPLDEPETDTPDSAESPDDDSEASGTIGLGELYTMYPQALDKEAAALIQARNSVVAAWLWRRYAATTRLATNQIRIDPWCGVIGLSGAG
jgi:hypothetical protein